MLSILGDSNMLRIIKLTYPHFQTYVKGVNISDAYCTDQTIDSCLSLDDNKLYTIDAEGVGEVKIIIFFCKIEFFDSSFVDYEY